MAPRLSPSTPRSRVGLPSRIGRAALRQCLLGLVVAGASLPLLSGLTRVLGLARPPLDSLGILVGSVALAFAGGGAVGVFLAARGAGRRVRPLSALAGLVWGIGLCSAVVPVYLDSVLDDLTDSGTAVVASHVEDVWDHPRGALDQMTAAAGQLAQEGLTRLPALVLLGWVVLGPALVAPLEARPPKPL